MRNFSFERASTATKALQLLSHLPNPKILAGGTNLVDLMRSNIESPEVLVDISRMENAGVIELRSDGSIVIAATAKNSDVANHPAVREHFPLLSRAILSGASGQIRNMATVGGNLMQRTRCPYFYDIGARCNKRSPQSGCDAIDGFNRMHAILGASDSCVATHPSDMCVALAALDAVVNLEGPSRSRSIALNDFHLLPGDTPHFETRLSLDELVTSIEIPGLRSELRTQYRKVRDRSSFAFALASVAAVLGVENSQVTEIRIAFGGVATKPWRALKAERFLLGRPATTKAFIQAADEELASARTLAHNHFKIELARRAMVSVLEELASEVTT